MEEAKHRARAPWSILILQVSRCVPAHLGGALAYLLQDNDDAADATEAPLLPLLAQICVTSSELEEGAVK